MRIVLLGTGPFAVPTLRALHGSPHEVVCAVSRPPRSRRGEPSPVQLAAQELGVEVWLPEPVNCDQARAELAALEPDLLVVCDYGEILKPPTLASSQLGGINLHGSLLPKYRGAAPVQWAILNGDTETGNTVIQMTPGLDAGPRLGVQRIAIDPDDTGMTLYYKLVDAAVRLFERVLACAQHAPLAGRAQEGPGSYHPRAVPFEGTIDPRWPRARIERFIRALDFPPYAPASVSIGGVPRPVRSLEAYDRWIAPGRNSRASASCVSLSTPNWTRRRAAASRRCWSGWPTAWGN